MSYISSNVLGCNEKLILINDSLRGSYMDIMEILVGLTILFMGIKLIYLIENYDTEPEEK